jgi:hypothetical protein
MSELEELEKRIRRLPADQFAKFREWFLEFDKAGKLDKLVAEALADYRAGKAREV